MNIRCAMQTNPTSPSFPPLAAVQGSKIDLQSNIQMFTSIYQVKPPLAPSLILCHDQEDD